MSNPFDQFDAPAGRKARGTNNPFDQFDGEQQAAPTPFLDASGLGNVTPTYSRDSALSSAMAGVPDYSAYPAPRIRPRSSVEGAQQFADGTLVGRPASEIDRTWGEAFSDTGRQVSSTAKRLVGSLPDIAAGAISAPGAAYNWYADQFERAGGPETWRIPTVSGRDVEREVIDSRLGLGNLSRSLFGAFSDGIPQSLAETMAGSAEADLAGMSPKAQAQQQEFEGEDSLFGALSYLATNPSFTIPQLVGQAPQFAALFVPGGVGTKLVSQGALAGGMSASEVSLALAEAVEKGEISQYDADQAANLVFGASTAINTSIPAAMGPSGRALERVAAGTPRVAAGRGASHVGRATAVETLGEGVAESADHELVNIATGEEGGGAQAAALGAALGGVVGAGGATAEVAMARQQGAPQRRLQRDLDELRRAFEAQAARAQTAAPEAAPSEAMGARPDPAPAPAPEPAPEAAPAPSEAMAGAEPGLAPRAPEPADQSATIGEVTREQLIEQWRNAQTPEARAAAAARIAEHDGRANDAGAPVAGPVDADGAAGAEASEAGLPAQDRGAPAGTPLSPDLIGAPAPERGATGYVPSDTPTPSSREVDKAYLKQNIDTMPDPTPEQLPNNPGAYFDLRSADAVVPTSSLVPSKKERASATALRRMAASADGLIPRRGSIDVRDNGDGTYTILDGNGSHAAAEAMGLTEMPIRIVEAPAGREGWRNPRGYLQGEASEQLTALYEQAAESKPEFDDIIAGVAGEFGAKPITVPLKGRTRSEQKTRDENNGDVSKLNDVLRGSIILTNPGDAAQMIDRLRQSGSVIKEKNAFDMSKPSPYWGGYRDAKVIFEMPNGARAEVILMTDQMEAAKAKAHEDYEIARVAYADLSNGVNASDNITAFVESVRRMVETYRPAEEALRSAANSSSESRQSPSGENARSASADVSMRGEGSYATSTGVPPGPGTNADGSSLSGGPPNSSEPGGGSAGIGVTPSPNSPGLGSATSGSPSAEGSTSDTSVQQGAASEKVRSAARAALPRKAKLVAVRSIPDLSAEVRERAGLTEADGDVEGFYDSDTGTAYIIEDNLVPRAGQSVEARAAWVAAHEWVGHHGLRGLAGDQLQTILRRAASNDTVAAVVRALEREAGRPERGDRLVEEAIVELAAAVRTGDFTEIADRYGVTFTPDSRGELRALFDRILNALRRALGSNHDFTNAELYDLISDSAAYSAGGAETALTGDRVPFSRPRSRAEGRGISPDAQATVNIGLSTKEVTGSDKLLTPARVRRALKQATGMVPLKDTKVTSQSEPTLVVDLERPLTAEEGNALSVALDQQAIAQRNVAGGGDLFGPMADAWGPYDPAMFMLHDGLDASVEAPATKPPTLVDILYGDEETPNLRRNDNIARWLEQRTLDVIGEPLDIGDPAARDLVADAIADEAIAAMGEEGSALEWYDSTIRRTMGMLALKHPEIETDPDARTAYTIALAITSLNMSVSQNVQLADAAYESYQRDGRFSSRGAGKGASVMESSFENINALLDELGSVEALRDFMDRPFTVRELRDMGYTVSGENIDTQVQGSAILGPKIGTGFYQNLNGNFSPVTIDLWFMRMIGRLTGQILNSSVDSGRIQRAADGFRNAMSSRETGAIGVRKTLGIDPASVTEDQTFDVAMQIVAAHEKDYRNNRKQYDSGRRKKSKQVYAAEALKTAATGLVASPRSGNERNNLRDIVGMAVDKVRERTGQDIPAASLQAVVWYPEQELYRKLGSKQRETSVDYATAVKALLEKEGYDAQQLERAAGPGAEPAQRGAGGDVDGSDAQGRAPRSRSRRTAAGRRGRTAQAFSAKPRQPDAVSADAYHYSNTPGLTELDPTFAGTAGAGRERRAFGMGRFGERGGTYARLNFYVRDPGEGVPGAEDVVRGAGGSNLYRVQLDNLYDLDNDPRGIAEEAGSNSTLMEEMVSEAGYDGFLAGRQPGIDSRVAVVFDIGQSVPVENVDGSQPLPEPAAQPEPDDADAWWEQYQARQRAPRSTARRTREDALGERGQLFGRLAADGYQQGSPTQPQPRTGGRFVRVERAADGLREGVHDKMLPILRMQQRVSSDSPAISSVTLDDAMNVYRMENLMHGAVKNELDRQHQKNIQPIQDAIRKSPFTMAQFEDYLYAKAAPERNAEIAKINSAMPDGGSGITTATASAVLDGVADGPISGKRLTPESIELFESIEHHVRDMRDTALNNMVEAGQISQELADALREKYPNYIPMRGRDGELDEGREPGRGRGLSQRGSGMQRALGRGEDNIPKNIMGELVGDLQRSVVAAGKGKVAQGMLRFALANPMPDLYTVEPVDMEWKFSEATGEAYLGVVRRGEDQDSTMVVMHNGKPVMIRFHDAGLRDAVLNMTANDMDALTKYLGFINRWRSAVLTRYNPAFTLVNVARDFQFGVVAIAAEHGAAIAAKTVMEYPAAAAASYRHAANQRGDASVPAEQRTMDDWAAAFYGQGASTGITMTDDVVKLQRRLVDASSSIMQLAAQGRPWAVARESVYRAGKPIIDVIETANEASENSIRLAVFKTLVLDGMTEQKAAEYAKNVTINFNRKGKYTGVLNGLFLFFNAAMQGSHAVLRVLKNRKVMAFLAGMASLQGMLAAQMMDDDDGDGITRWDMVPPWTRRTSLVIPIGEDGYFALPMPYGFNFFTYLGGRGTQRMILGDRPTDTSITSDLLSSITESFSPIPFHDGYRGMFGDQIGFIMGLASNRDDFGNPIAASNPYEQYDVPKALTGNVNTPRVYHATAQLAAKLGGGDLDERIPPVGYLDFAPEHLEQVTNYLGGGVAGVVNKGIRWWENMDAGNMDGAMDTVSQLPILSRLMGTTNANRAIAERYYGERGEFRRHADIVKGRIDSGMELEEAIADRPAEFRSGIQQTTYQRHGRTQDGRRYRRGQPRVDAEGRPITEYAEGTPGDVLRRSERRVTDINSTVREIRAATMTNEQVFNAYESHYRAAMVELARAPERTEGAPADIGLPEGYDPDAVAPARIRNRTIRLLQEMRSIEQQRLPRAIEYERTLDRARSSRE